LATIEVPSPAELSGAARSVLDVLAVEGASFLGDVARSASLLPSVAEEALWELVARGLVTGDGFTGLRSLLAKQEASRRERRLRAIGGGRARHKALPAGRWSLLRRAARSPEGSPEEIAAGAAQRLLRRFGVVFREMTTRESLMPPWRVVLAALRRLEARGEVRGGRFVAGIIGEQYAAPEAVEALRAVRREPPGQLVVIAAADPLNLVGILTPGARISPQSKEVIAYADGVPIEIGELGTVRSRLAARGHSA
jgi:ATP-dependent Lhr-like helicase